MNGIARASLVIAFATIGCSDSSPGTDPTAASSTFSAPGGLLDTLERLARPSEAIYVQMAQQVPSYGGHYLDATQKLVVTIADTTDRNIAIRAARTILGEGGDIGVRKVDYSWAQLAQQRALLNSLAFSLSGVQQTAISILRNRFEVGVSSPEELAPVSFRLRDGSSIPDAISVILADRIALSRQAMCNGPNLNDCRRPVHAGLRVIYERGGYAYGCTLGMVTSLSDGTRGFVTNSHCSTSPYQLETGSYWQYGDADQHGSQYLIGTEHLDPPPFAYMSNRECPVGFRCRHSDANFVRFTTANHMFKWFFHPNDLSSAGGSLTLNTTDSISMSNLAGGPPGVGFVVAKLGQATGYTEGIVDYNCMDRADPVDPSLILLCQLRIVRVPDRFGNDGDSGAPVYTWNGDNVALVYGILWAVGHEVSSGHHVGYASSSEQIQRDLGSLSLLP